MGFRSQSSNHDFSSWHFRHLSFLHDSVDVETLNICNIWNECERAFPIINIYAWFRFQDQTGRLFQGLRDFQCCLRRNL